jgi:chaperonin GroES
MNKIKPLHDRVLVKRIDSSKDEKKGGIFIPDTAKEKPQEGEVVAIGNGKVLENGTRVALEVKVGDHVLFAKYAGTEIKVENLDVLIMREEEILGIISGSAKSKSVAA